MEFAGSPTKNRHIGGDVITNYIIKAFHKLYYDKGGESFFDLKWMGVPIAKCPLDLWQYQEIVYETKPTVVIETGTWCGGSTLYLRTLLNNVLGYGKGMVVTIDVMPLKKVEGVGIIQLVGNSVSQRVVETVRDLITNESKVMVILDSDHHREHVLKELDMYGSMVSEGCYLVVEDTNVNGHPVRLDYGLGPWEALEEWLPKHPEFVRDEYRERLLMTFNPGGYYKKVSLEGGRKNEIESRIEC